jgi:hypothetical protein
MSSFSPSVVLVYLYSFTTHSYQMKYSKLCIKKLRKCKSSSILSLHHVLLYFRADDGVLLKVQKPAIAVFLCCKHKNPCAKMG